LGRRRRTLFLGKERSASMMGRKERHQTYSLRGMGALNKEVKGRRRTDPGIGGRQVQTPPNSRCFEHFELVEDQFTADFGPEWEEDHEVDEEEGLQVEFVLDA
jgi:hypothetical protein